MDLAQTLQVAGQHHSAILIAFNVGQAVSDVVVGQIGRFSLQPAGQRAEEGSERSAAVRADEKVEGAGYHDVTSLRGDRNPAPFLHTQFKLPSPCVAMK